METAKAGWRLTFQKRRQFYWKSALLAVTTLALIPILLLKTELAAKVYLVFLLAVHLGGLVIFLYGVQKHDIAPSRNGLWIRLLGIGIAIALLMLAAKGLRSEVGSAVFWVSLFLVWALHTGALALLHVRGQEMGPNCPFV